MLCFYFNRHCYSNIQDEFMRYLKFHHDVRFGEPIPDSIIEEMSRKKFAMKSYANMKWCLAMFKAWTWARNRRSPGSVMVDLENVATITKQSLSHDLSHFIVETRKQDGSEYPSKMLKHILLIIQMYLSSIGLVFEFLEDSDFVGLRNCLDNKMKENAKKGLSRKVKKAEPLEASHMEMLWEGNFLGDDSPRKMSETLVFLIGINCGLHAGVEHRSLRRPGFDPQINVIMKDGVECLEYIEDISTKTNQGGLKH